MKGSLIFKDINKDPVYLIKDYLNDGLIMLAFIAILLITNFSFSVDYNAYWLLLIPFSIMNGMMTASLLHNTSHNNIQNVFINRIIGEYCGYWVLYGFKNFVLVHFLHHKFSDEELDPVNPQGMSFLVFLTAPLRYMIATTKKYLRMTHGHHENYEDIMTLQILVFHINLVLRLTIWYLLLGPTLFWLVYIPGILTIVAVFAHINYNCHVEHEDGSVEIVNLNHNLYYKVANFFTMGGYYHLNHHKNMNLFDPRFKTNVHATNGLQAYISLVLRKF